MRILITGGAGFIGSHTVDHLLDQHHQVLVLDNLSSGNLAYLNLQHPQLEFIEGDVLEYPLVFDLLKDCDAVLHLAAIASVPLSISEPIYSFQVNTQGFLHVLQAVRQLQRPVRVVYASSAAVYGDITSLPCDDTKALHTTPLSPYALQKMHDEHYANLYYRLFGIKSLGLRYFNVYGPRQDPHSPYSGVISRFLTAFANKQPLTVFGNGEQSRDFITVKEVAKANALALTSDFHGAVNIATGTPETLLNVITYLEAASGQSAIVRFEAARSGDILSSYGSTQLAAEALLFKATTALKDGIKPLLTLP
jgi:UDP-glucose 4-epimerase